MFEDKLIDLKRGGLLQMRERERERYARDKKGGVKIFTIVFLLKFELTNFMKLK